MPDPTAPKIAPDTNIPVVSRKKVPDLILCKTLFLISHAVQGDRY